MGRAIRQAGEAEKGISLKWPLIIFLRLLVRKKKFSYPNPISLPPCADTSFPSAMGDDGRALDAGDITLEYSAFEGGALDRHHRGEGVADCTTGTSGISALGETSGISSSRGGGSGAWTGLYFMSAPHSTQSQGGGGAQNGRFPYPVVQAGAASVTLGSSSSVSTSGSRGIASAGGGSRASDPGGPGSISASSAAAESAPHDGRLGAVVEVLGTGNLSTPGSANDTSRPPDTTGGVENGGLSRAAPAPSTASSAAAPGAASALAGDSAGLSRAAPVAGAGDVETGLYRSPAAAGAEPEQASSSSSPSPAPGEPESCDQGYAVAEDGARIFYRLFGRKVTTLGRGGGKTSLGKSHTVVWLALGRPKKRPFCIALKALA